jgi:hypothetical protein
MNTRTCDSPTISNSDHTANIDIRSNVHLRSEKPLVSDREFVRHVRGRAAIGKLLRRLGPNLDPAEAGRQSLLTVRQAAEWAWEKPCELCGCIAEGPVKKGPVETIEFRCPLGQCLSRAFVPRALLLDVSLVDIATRRAGRPLNDVVHLALESNWRESSSHKASVRSPRRYLVSLTPWQAYMLTDADVEQALACYLRELADA